MFMISSIKILTTKLKLILARLTSVSVSMDTEVCVCKIGNIKYQ